MRVAARGFVVISFLAAAASTAFGQSQNANGGYVRPDAGTRAKRYAARLFGPHAIVGAAAGTGVSTCRNSPAEGEPNARGFCRRFASNIGKSVIKNTTAYALEETFRLDGSYYTTTKHGFGAKFKNTLVSTFTTGNASGKRIFRFPRVTGTHAAKIVAAEPWYPDHYGVADGFRMGTISLGTDVLFNMLREFVRR